MNNTIKFIIVVSIALLSTDLVYHQAVKAYGQEVNNNNGTNTTNSIDIEPNCFDTIESHDIFSEYYGWSRCVL